MELGFFKMFIWFLPQKSLRRPYIRARFRNGKLEIYGRRRQTVPNLLQKVQRCKNEIRKICIGLLDDLQSSQYCKFSDSNELLQFINCTLRNLEILVRKEAGSVVYVRMQISALIKKLRLFRDFVKSTGKGLCFSINVEEWAKKVACVSTLYWVEEEEDRLEEAMLVRMKDILSDLLEMVESYTPEVVGIYVRILKVSEISPPDAFQTGEVVSSFVDFLLPFGFMKILREELIFLITFIMNPIEREVHKEDWDLMVIKAKVIAFEVPSLVCSLTFMDTNQETQERNILISDFQEKTDKVKSQVRQLLHFQIRSYFPAIDASGFIDFLLENSVNLKERSFARDKLVTLHRELLSVRTCLKCIHAMQNESVELKGLCIQISDAAGLAEHAIDSCQVFDTPIWYSLLYLSDAIEEIKFITRQMKKIMNREMHPNLLLSAKENSGSIHLGQAHNNSRLDGVVVGLEDEAETIVNRLTRGSTKLDIVSIVGMPGQGKTTLARKVYHSPSIQRHFHKHAWCFVTQVYEPKTVLLDILREVTSKLGDEANNMSIEDLAPKLYKCLKGQRYLIIMDDIWDAATWNAVKESFPDDENGSRILFTSRNKFVCDPHLLRSLSDTEAMKLLEQQVLPKDGWPSSFSDDMKKVLKICNGLPLAIVVVAGLLKNVSNDFVKWRQIVQTLNPKLVSEGCTDILELSYKDLPDFLKPCFLYLGAAGQNKVFKVCKLIQLWIAEGFVPKSGTKCQEELGMEYLENLIGRSLVIVHKRDFSSGEIKECRVHDLLLGFCSKKAEEERFMHFSEPVSCNHYRLCIFGVKIFHSVGKGPKLRSLLFHLDNSQFPFHGGSTYSFFFRLRFLRVLDLGTVSFGRHFPEPILLLICLRYLCINFNTEAVPLSIGILRNLETFHVVRWIRKEVILQLPHTIWNMKSLRNINVGRGSITLLDDNASSVCPQLGNLHSFSSLCLCNVEDAEQILRGFPSVRKLKLEISLLWDCKGNCDRFQNQVLHSLNKLESLNLKYYPLARQTCALNLPTTLKKLTLSMFNGSWSEISTIGKLPNLEVFKLGFIFWGDTWVVEDEEFLNLKYLKLTRLAVSRWEVSTSSFPCLEQLVVKKCNFLAELPSRFEDVLTLKTIQVLWCPESLSTSAESIRNEQRDLGNEDLEVLISNEIIDHDLLHELEGKALEFLEEMWAKSFLDNTNMPDDQIEFDFELYELYEFYEKNDIDSKRRYDQSVGRTISKKESARRMNLILKHNCQPRQAVMSRHNKQELKRDR